jgi:hypothetical protein
VRQGCWQRRVVGAGATADRSADQVARPGCLGLNSRRRDALTTAPQQETAPHPSIERRAPIRRHLSMMPRNCDALPSTDPDEISTQASGRDLAQSSGWIPLHHIFRRTTGSEVLCWIREGVSPSAVQRRQMWRMVGPSADQGTSRSNAVVCWVDASGRSPLVLGVWCGYLCLRCSIGRAKQQYCRRQCSETYSPLLAQAVGR